MPPKPPSISLAPSQPICENNQPLPPGVDVLPDSYTNGKVIIYVFTFMLKPGDSEFYFLPLYFAMGLESYLHQLFFCNFNGTTMQCLTTTEFCLSQTNIATSSSKNS